MRFAKRSNHEVLATEREPEGQAKRSNAGGNMSEHFFGNESTQNRHERSTIIIAALYGRYL